MSGDTNIQWTDRVWNPTIGCTRVSAGCDHCYAFALHDQRHIAWKRGRWLSAPEQYHQPFSKVRLLPDRLGDPLRWRKPQRVFVNSMSDLFHPDVPDDFIAQVFAVMAASVHTFQILTKRPERMRFLMSDHTFEAMVDAQIDALDRQHDWVRITDFDEWPLPNVWLGVSVEDQAAADERIPLLLQTPAVVRFLSCEPLLGRINLLPWLTWPSLYRGSLEEAFNPDADETLDLHWVIAGGESGPHARPMELEWARSLRAQCAEAGTSFFMKQLGSVWARELRLLNRHGGDPSEWPTALLASLYMREWPEARPETQRVAP